MLWSCLKSQQSLIEARAWRRRASSNNNVEFFNHFSKYKHFLSWECLWGQTKRWRDRKPETERDSLFRFQKHARLLNWVPGVALLAPFLGLSRPSSKQEGQQSLQGLLWLQYKALRSNCQYNLADAQRQEKKGRFCLKWAGTVAVEVVHLPH